MTKIEKAKMELRKKLAALDEIGRVIKSLESDLEYYSETSEVTGQEQRVDREGNLIFNDDGTPSMRDVYTRRPMTDKEIEDVIGADTYAGNHILGLRAVKEYLEKYTV